MKTTRLSGNFPWIIGWCLFLGGLSLFVAAVSPSPLLRGIYAVFSGLYLITALGLYRMTPWGRILGGVVLLLGAVLQAMSLRRGFSSGKLLRALMNLYWGAYLFLPATRRLFAASGGGRLDRINCLVQSAYLVLAAVMVVLTVVFKVPTWAGLAGFTAVAGTYVFFEDRLTARLSSWLASRPDGLSRPDWNSFRTAREAWRSKDFARAEAILAPLPDSPPLRLLRGILRMDRAMAGVGLGRILYDYTFVAQPGQRQAIGEECETEDLDARAAERAALVDDLLADDARPIPIFPGQVDSRIQSMTGQLFLSHPEFQHREAWLKRRPLCTGDRARVWLTLRLWDAQCPEAAETAARAAKDPGLVELAGLTARLESGGGAGVSDIWLVANALNLCLLPALSDAARLLYLDSPYLQGVGTETVAARMTARIEVIALLRRLRDEYPAESCIETPWLLALFVGGPDGVPQRKAKFERWWAERRAGQLEFDGAFVSGLDAARKEDWVHAERAFAEAAKAWPGRTCAVYNHAFALLNLRRPREAEAIFMELAAKDKDEAVYWMRIGDARRMDDRPGKALEAYRVAARLGGLEEEVAFRMGMTLASEGKEDEAARQLDAATGPDADPEKLEELAAFLESQGIYRLAGRYREQAFLRRLGDKPDRKEGEEEEKDEGLEPSA
jgi:thioredoxin-like negative regulator of GroEL